MTNPITLSQQHEQAKQFHRMVADFVAVADTLAEDDDLGTWAQIAELLHGELKLAELRTTVYLDGEVVRQYPSRVAAGA